MMLLFLFINSLLFQQSISITDFNYRLDNEDLVIEFKVSSTQQIDSISVSYLSYDSITPIYDVGREIFTARINVKPDEVFQNDTLKVFAKDVLGLQVEEAFVIQGKTDFITYIDGKRDSTSFPRFFEVHDTINFSGRCSNGCTISLNRWNKNIITTTDTLNYTFEASSNIGDIKNYELVIENNTDSQTLLFEIITTAENIFELTNVIDISEKYIVTGGELRDEAFVYYAGVFIYDLNNLELITWIKNGSFIKNDVIETKIADSVLIGYVDNGRNYGVIRAFEFYSDTQYLITTENQRYFISENRDFISFRGGIQKTTTQIEYPEKINFLNKELDFDGIDNLGNLAQVYFDGENRASVRIRNINQTTTLLLKDSTKTKSFYYPKVYNQNLVFSEYSTVLDKYFLIALFNGRENIIDSSATAYNEFDYVIEEGALYFRKTDELGNNNVYSYSEENGSSKLTSFGPSDLRLVNINSNRQAVAYVPSRNTFYFIDDTGVEEIVFEGEEDITFFESSDHYYFYNDKVLRVIPYEKKIFTSVENIESPKASVTHINLKNAYPNPFNPQTNISFSLNENSILSLKVYNSLGQLVTILFENKYYPGGEHMTSFSAVNLPSGVYFYTLSSQEFSTTKKMMLVK